MDVQQIVNNVIEEFGANDEISNIDLAKIAGFNDEEIEFVKLFWDPAFNRSWIYLTKAMVIEWLGYEDGKNTMSNFYNQNLIKNYELDIEYKEVDQNDEIVKKFHSLNLRNEKLGNRAKYYLVTGECLKSLLMSTQTLKGKMVKKYYIKTESLVVIMLELVKKQQQIMYERKLKQKDKLIEQKNEEIKQITDEKNWLHTKTKEKVSFKKYTDEVQAIYAGAHETELKNYIIKVGKSIRPATRTGDFSTSNAPLNAFKTLSKYNLPKEISHPSETFIHQLLSPYETKEKNLSAKEHFMIHPTFLNYLLIKFTNNIQDLVRDINYHLTLLEDNNYDFDKVQEIIETDPKFQDFILKVKECENVITKIEIPTINSDEQSESSSSHSNEQSYEEEILISQDIIDNETNKLKVRKMVKRNEFIIMMNSLGFKVISKYKTRESKIDLLCKYNHVFTIKPCDHDLDKVACYECTNAEKTKEGTELVKDRGMVCINYNERKFRCKEGHEFISGDLNYILHKDGGCTVCNNRVKITKEDYHKIARINNGKWIEEDKTPTSRETTKWICEQGHQFEAKYPYAKKSWNTQCSICKERRVTLEYQEKINKKLAKYPSAKLLTDSIKKLGQSVKFCCSHIPEGWEVKLDKWMQRENWKCRKCKEELGQEETTQDEIEQE